MTAYLFAYEFQIAKNLILRYNCLMGFEGLPVFDGFSRIKAIPVPYEDLEEGLAPTCQAVNQLPFAITTGRSGGTYLRSDHDAPADDGYETINYGHLTIALDANHPLAENFSAEGQEIADKYTEIEFSRRQIGEMKPDDTEPIDCNFVIDIEITRVPPFLTDAEVSTAVRAAIAKEPGDPRDIRKIEIRRAQIEEADAQQKIQQFASFMEDLKVLATEFQSD